MNPSWMRNICKRLLPTGCRRPLRAVVRNLPGNRQFRKQSAGIAAFLRQAQWWNADQVRQWQLERLQGVVEYAYAHIAGYRQLYEEAGVGPRDIQTLEDMQQLPFTTKELIRDNPDEFCDPQWSQADRYRVTTGGSIGTPLAFYHTQETMAKEDAFVRLHLDWAGWSQTGTIAYLMGSYVGSKDDVFDYQPIHDRLLLSSYYLCDQAFPAYLRSLQAYDVHYLLGYASSVAVLASLMIANDLIGTIPIRGFFLCSEPVFEWQLMLLRKAFPDASITASYGQTEQVLYASWCEAQARYHVWPFYGYAEIIDHEGAALSRPGHVGEVVGTGFWNYCMPFIRYRTRDMARLGGTHCKQCHRQFLILDEIEGRVHDALISRTGRKHMFPSGIHGELFDSVKQLQYYQDEPGKVSLRIVAKPTDGAPDVDPLVAELRRYLGDEFELRVEFVEEIPRTARGKQPIVVQKLV
jgi:phenylacetate-CoA ligase